MELPDPDDAVIRGWLRALRRSEGSRARAPLGGRRFDRQAQSFLRTARDARTGVTTPATAITRGGTRRLDRPPT